MEKDKNPVSKEFWRQRYKRILSETEQLERNFPKSGSGKEYDEYGGKLMSLQGSTARLNIIASSWNSPTILDLDKPSADLMTRQDDLMRRYIRMRKINNH